VEELPVDHTAYKLFAPVRASKPEARAPPGTRLVRGPEAEEIVKRTLPRLYTRDTLWGLVGPPSNVYYRVYKSSEGYAVFYLFEWPDQKIPPHKWDYEPVIVIADRQGNPREVYVDGYHYFVSGNRVRGEWWIEVTGPWRSMAVRRGRPGGDMASVYPIGETTRPGPLPRYLSDRVLAGLRSRSENPLKVSEKLIRDPWSVRNAEHWATYRTPTVEELARDILENYGLLGKLKNHQLTARIVLALLRAKAKMERLLDRARDLIT